MELFNAFENHIYLAMYQLLREIATGKEYRDYNALRQALHTGYTYDSRIYSDDIEAEDTLLRWFFKEDIKSDGEKIIRLRYHLADMAPMSRPPELYELIWLSMLLRDKKASAMLPPPLREKLLSRLRERRLPDGLLEELWVQQKSEGDDLQGTAFFQQISLYLSALLQKHCLHADWYDADGTRHSGTVCPCRLAYDLADSRFRFIVWEPQSRQILSLRASRTEKLELLDTPLPDTLAEELTAYYDSHRLTATLTVVNKKTAVERCFLAFADYDKEACADEAFGKYTLKVSYYDFDQKNIIKKLLSLGPMVIVEEPSQLRNELIERTKAIYALYAQAADT